ncbi:NTTRR-F1 domain [Paenibacillus validus]|uniref:NTTRR-F1 domain n=1 Tax=Paenibacillus validus TaxID=44253 RepID=A0A7X2ZEL3_9BACL|nr:NTTRR-F1 domain [Paenibacillus validus]MUG72736.1 NTTRR-F1 domain [Paenibacillus validus]
MSITNIIVNGGFETGSLLPWINFNATITTDFSHSGFYAARLLGGDLNSFITQFVPATPGESYEFLVSLAKVGTAPSPPISLTVAFYNDSFTFLGYGLITTIQTDRLPDVNDDTWLEIYQTTSVAPAGTVASH